MVKLGADSARQHGFERLVAPWRDDLYRYVYWLCRDPDLADDVVQETMLRAFKSLDKLEDESAIKPWLLTIARREHARVYERKRLDDEYREPLVLQVLMGFSTREIATMMGLRQGAVLTRLHRARKKLMEQVKSELDLIG
jgi:RNA polymerase sigma-70 factor (ECF subfamily)